MPDISLLFDTAAARSLDARVATLLDDGGQDLMAQAGLAAWQCLLQQWPDAQRLAVVAGPGNNGGDAWVLALHALQAGRAVVVWHLPGQHASTPLAAAAAAEYTRAGGAAEAFQGTLGPADVIVDGLFGLGLSRAPEAAAHALIEAINAHGAPVLALDVPSGVDADRGAVSGVAVQATLTLQFIANHRGLFTGQALAHTGQRRLAPLQWPDAAAQGLVAAARRWSPPDLAAHLRPRHLNAHKGDSGHVLAVGGNHGSGGALLLTTQAALRSGAGLLSLATRPEHVPAVLSRVPEAMCHGLDAVPALAPLLARASVLAIGPGLGQDQWASSLWQQARGSGLPLVVDADALNLLAQSPQPLADAVLTPHPGEAARLLGCSSAEVQADRFSAVRVLAERYACTVVLKGAGTLVAAPGELTALIAAGNPGMAVGGMGDLLTGVIAALRAQGMGAFQAAACGALLHAAAGDLAATDGQRGLLPTDLLAPLRRLCNPGSTP